MFFITEEISNFMAFYIAVRNKPYHFFSLGKTREQMRSEMGNISEKITEEGGQFRMFIPTSITWKPLLLITMYNILP